MLKNFVVLVNILALVTSTQLTLNLYDVNNVNLRCNDGTPGGYYIRYATQDASDMEKNLWMFYQEGGGWCYNEASCIERLRPQYSSGSHLSSSQNWPPTKEVVGIFDMLDTPFEKANLVFLPYCSADAHMGNHQYLIDVTGEGEETVYFNGRFMALYAVTSLIGEKVDQKIAFTGLSAGARGSMVTIDFLKDMLPSGTYIRGIHDSGAYQDIEAFPGSGLTKFGEQCGLAYEMYQPPISSECAEEYSSEIWKCLCGEYMLPHVLTPSQVIIYQYDSFQIGENFHTSPNSWTPEMCQYVEGQLKPGLLQTILDIEQDNYRHHHVAFGPSCYAHGILDVVEFRSIVVDGQSAQTQFLNFFFDNATMSAYSSCQGVNCQITCPYVDLGANSRCEALPKSKH